MPASNLSTREDQLNSFLEARGWGGAQRHPIEGDASFRRYARLRHPDGRTAMLMDAPPSQENAAPFIAIANILLGHGLSAPKILAEDIAHGFLLLEDLGDDRFSRVLAINNSEEDKLYTLAADVLLHLHRQETPSSVPRYDNALLRREYALLAEWYLPLVLSGDILARAQAEYTALWENQLSGMHVLPPVLVLRDYHADNLMWLPERGGIARAGLLDFQDAVTGPPTYDLVSLLEDARRDVAPALADKTLEYYLSGAPHLGREEFLASYSLLGAQRNCKILGIFARLAKRDGKRRYLAMLPRVWGYLERDMAHRELATLLLWCDRYIPASVRNQIPVLSSRD